MTKLNGELTRAEKQNNKRVEKILSDKRINEAILKQLRSIKRKLKLKDIKELNTVLGLNKVHPDQDVQPLRIEGDLLTEKILMEEIIEVVKRNNEDRVIYASALTLVAKNGNPLATKWIKEIAGEIGQQLAFFYKKKLWIVGGINLSLKINGNFGRDVYSLENKEDREDGDIYIQTIRKSFIKALMKQKGINKEHIVSIANKIVRSLPTVPPELPRTAASA